MKNIKIIFVCITSLILMISCQTNESNDVNEINTLQEANKASEEIVTINHTYNYYGKRFYVSYTFDERSKEVLRTEGDTKYAESIFGNRGKQQKSLFFNNPKKGNKDIEVMVFDTSEDLKEYTNRISKDFPGDVEQSDVKQNKCNSMDIGGTGSFYFYKHAYYNTEMLGMRRVGRYYYRDHWVGSANNDQLSSLVVAKPENRQAVVYLYQHYCYGGRVIGFYQPQGYDSFGIGNLSWYTMSGWWWWKKSWNDQVSSTSGWAW